MHLYFSKASTHLLLKSSKMTIWYVVTARMCFFGLAGVAPELDLVEWVVVEESALSSTA